jgi:colanic acid biosynthesis glycosyl transferase WcaI
MRWSRASAKVPLTRAARAIFSRLRSKMGPFPWSHSADWTKDEDAMQKNILYISPYFWPENIGSAPYCTDLCNWLLEKGHGVHVLSFRPHYPSTELYTAWANGSRDQEDYNGAHILRIKTRGRGRGGLRDRLASDLGFLIGVARCSFRRVLPKTDVIVAYVPSCLSLFGAAVFAWRTGAPVIGVVHDIESGLAASLGIARPGILLHIMRVIERVAFNRVATMIVLTDGMASELRGIGCRRPIVVLPIWSAVFPEEQSSPVVAGNGPGRVL